MTAATVRTSSSGLVVDGGTTLTVTYPGTPVAGDIIGIWLTDASARTATASGWTVAYSTTFGSASRSFLHRTYASGTSQAITIGAGGYSIAWVCVVFDGAAHTGFGTIGTITTRGGSATTSTAAATGDTTAPNLVVAHEKASTHTGAPTVSPSTTAIQNQYTNNASDPATYVGTYDTAGGTASRTVTYSTASANGAAYQIPMNLVPPPEPDPVTTANRKRTTTPDGYGRTGLNTRTTTTEGVA